MNQKIINHFINDTDYTNQTTIQKVGSLNSSIGIGCNIVLFISKLVLGFLSGSVSLISDGLNNLSDCGSCLVSIWGYKMAAKPADKDHPFGHGRAEYVSTFIVAILIVYVGLESCINSVKKIINPNIITMNWITLIILGLTIVVKLWMGSFYNYSYKLTNNSTLKASSMDSYNDCLVTFITMVALILSQFSTLPFDGMMSTIVSIIILKGGVELVHETINQLIGQTPDETLIDQLQLFLAQDKMILGTHDVLLHYYGQQVYGSAHVEVDSRLNILEIHEHIDTLERQAAQQLKINLTLHMDPIVIGDAKIDHYHAIVNEYLSSLNQDITCHDFRVVKGQKNDNCIFDVSLPYGYPIDKKQFENEIQYQLNIDSEHLVSVVINYDWH